MQFFEYVRQVLKRRAATPPHPLDGHDCPKRRLLGFVDYEAGDFITMGLVQVKEGYGQPIPQDLVDQGINPEGLRRSFSTAGGRWKFLQSPSSMMGEPQIQIMGDTPEGHGPGPQGPAALLSEAMWCRGQGHSLKPLEVEGQIGFLNPDLNEGYVVKGASWDPQAAHFKEMMSLDTLWSTAEKIGMAPKTRALLDQPAGWLPFLKEIILLEDPKRIFP